MAAALHLQPFCELLRLPCGGTTGDHGVRIFIQKNDVVTVLFPVLLDVEGNHVGNELLIAQLIILHFAEDVFVVVDRTRQVLAHKVTLYPALLTHKGKCV